MTGVNPAAGESVLDTGLVPDLTTELAEADNRRPTSGESPVSAGPPTAAPAQAEGDRPARRFAVYDTRLERYVTGLVTEQDAAELGYSKTGRYRLHQPGTDGRLAPVSRP